MGTLITKLQLDRKSLHVGKWGVVCMLVLWGILLVAHLTLVFAGSATIFTFPPLFCSVTFVLLAVADLSQGDAPGLAVMLRSAGALAMVAGLSSLVAGIYLSAGAFWASAAAGGISLVMLGVFYFQQRRSGF